MKGKKLFLAIIIMLIAIIAIEFFINKDILLFDRNQEYIESNFQIDVNDKSYDLEHKEGIKDILEIYNAYLLQIVKKETAADALDLYSSTLAQILSTETTNVSLRRQIADLVHEHSKPFLMRDYSRKEIEVHNAKVKIAFEGIISELKKME
ncbi:hypothetical protein [Fusibacter ferrireducens]|uniref:Uncharacterized protein n=1 Tax=Fusibacter ferrireducens TaxID=2785058 RepID=A0ABR9ZNF6_9FIRM|nr:hypothetical protein [Fusibacter ferrireducens]MBF4692005.1 hypothetical protein [Fusibacter ferrireducens]